MAAFVQGTAIARMFVGSSEIAIAYAGIIPTWSAGPIEVPDPDTIPNANSFASVSNVELDTLTISEYIVPDGYDTPAVVTVAGGEYQIGTGVWSSAPGIINPGQPIRVRRNSSGSNSTGVQVIVTIGGVAMSFTILTKAGVGPDTIPDGASFTPMSDVEPSTVITSEYITLTGYNAAANVTIVGGEYQIESGAWVSTPGTINPGEDIRVRGTSSDQFTTATQVIITVGGVPITFTMTTRAALSAALSDPVLTLTPADGQFTWSRVMADLQHGDTIELDWVEGGANPDGVAEESQIVDARDLDVAWATFVNFTDGATVKWRMRYGRQLDGVWYWSNWSNILTDVQPVVTRYRYFELLTQTADNGGSSIGIAEVKIYEEIGGPDVAPGRTYTASGSLSAAYAPDKAFNGNTADFWTYNNAAWPKYLRGDCGSDPANWIKMPKRMVITTRSDAPYQAPSTGELRVSHDAATWITAIAVTDRLWTSGPTFHTQTFDAP